MNEWGFFCQNILVGIGKSATSFIFYLRRACLSDRQGWVRDERLVLSNLHSSLLCVMTYTNEMKRITVKDIEKLHNLYLNGDYNSLKVVWSQLSITAMMGQ